MTEAAVPGVYPQGVKLGVDVGTVRVGVAVCDRDGILATPLRTLTRNVKKNTDVRILANLAVELGAVEIFVGLPRTIPPEWPPNMRSYWSVNYRRPDPACR